MTQGVIRIWFAALWLAGTVACAAEEDPLPGDGDVGAREALLARLAAAPAPSFDLVRAVDRFERFATSYAGRVSGTPISDVAAQYLEGELAAAGYETRVLVYVHNGDPLRVVEGVRPGTEAPDRYTGIIAHYDVVAATEQGAYDNASGVAAALQLCELLAAADTRKSIACVFFDGEERGRIGSLAYVEEVVVFADADQGFAFDQVFGFDMVGLGWPGYPAWRQHVMLGLDTPALAAALPPNLALVEVVVREFLGLPAEGVEVHDVHFRNSDENSFKEHGVPAVRFAGGRNAFDYAPWHGPDDTVDEVYRIAGSPAAYAEGFAVTVELGYYLVLAYDAYDPLALPDLGM